MSHPQIRKAVLDAVHDAVSDPDGITWFDGRPAVFSEDELPGIAVYITDAQYTGDNVDGNSWEAVLHVEVILGASVTDTELDEWMEQEIFPGLESIPALAGLLESMSTLGYDYQRDIDANMWSSADMKYSIRYER